MLDFLDQSGAVPMEWFQQLITHEVQHTLKSSPLQNMKLGYLNSVNTDAYESADTRRLYKRPSAS
jgi:hypothetical protein